MADGMDGAGIYALANKPSVALQSPMDALKSAGEAASVINANRLFRANVARGQIMQQAIDPATGMPNPATANRLLAGSTDPDVALVAPEAVNQAQALQGHQQEQALQRLNNVRDISGSLMADNGGQGPTYERLQQVLNAHKAAGNLTDQDISTAMAGMPTGNDARSMATRLHILETFNDQAIAAQTRLTNLAGDRTSMSNGQVNQPGVVGGPRGPNYGAFTPAGNGIQQVTGPGENATLVDTYQPDPEHRGQYIRVKVPRANLPGATGVSGPNTPPGMVPPGPNPMGTGRRQAPPTTGLSPAPTTAPPPIPNTAAPVLAEPPGNVQADNTASIETFQKARQAVPAVNNTVQNLQHAYDALQLTNAGKSTETTHAMYSLLSAQGLVPQGLTDDVKNYDLFRKYTERYALDQAGGTNTDAGRAMTAAANASTGISTAANNEVLRNEIGRQRLAIATVKMAPDQTGLGYNAHAADLSGKVDPRGFSIDMYSPAELQKMVGGMKPEERAKFLKAAGIAKELGLVSPRQQAAPASVPAPVAAPRPAPQVPTTGY